MSFGNSRVAVAHIQVYDYDEGTDGENTPTITELQTLYGAADRWLGAFTDADAQTDVFQLGANLEIIRESGIERGLILQSSNGTRYLIQVDNDGDLQVTEL